MLVSCSGVFEPKDGGNIFLRNIGLLSKDYKHTALYSRTQHSSSFHKNSEYLKLIIDRALRTLGAIIFSLHNGA
jgi:hypothetical protein